MSRAREAAKRTQCLSNLRQIAIYLNMYANANHEQVPLGYCKRETDTTKAKQQNYFITMKDTTRPHPGTSVRYVGLGLLFPANIVKEASGRVFYCPSFDGDIFHSYNAISNPYLPTTNEVRITYSSRPGETPDDVDVPSDKSVCFASGKDEVPPGPNVAKFFVPQKWANNSRAPAEMMRLNKLKGKAIVSDINSSETRSITSHKGGFNCLYANGAAHWVDINARRPGFTDTLKFNMDQQMGAFTSAKNPIQDIVWYTLDAQ